MTNRTMIERKSERELVVTRTFDGPARIVFEAWTKPELMKLWWAPKSSGVPLRSCEMDVRVGGKYRLEFGRDAATSMAFFGKYIEVTPPSRLVWTNDEGEDASVTTVTFEDKGGQTLLILHETLSLKGSARRGHRRDGGRDARAVRAAGRAARHAGRQRVTIIRSVTR